MSDITTIARPYAKAIFNHALAKNQLLAWSVLLHDFSMAILDPRVERFISNPTVMVTDQVKLLFFVFDGSKRHMDKQIVDNLLKVLVNNKRLAVLPGIYRQFEILRADQEKTLVAFVTSFSALTSKEQKDLAAALSRRLQRQVTLEMNIDPTLIGGAVIRAGDLVIDGSVRGRLNKLGTQLAV